MSLIYTYELCGANPFDYLTQLQRHAQEVAAHPASWMPWNYRETPTVLPAAINPAATATTSTPWTTVPELTPTRPTRNRSPPTLRARNSLGLRASSKTGPATTRSKVYANARPVRYRRRARRQQKSLLAK